jgi:hypothetical protein
MMAEMVKAPTARHWAIPLAFGAVCFAWSNWIEDINAGTIIFFVACVLFLWAFVNFVHHVLAIRMDLRLEERDHFYMLSDTHRAEVIAKLNGEQLRAWMRGGSVLVGVQPAAQGPIYMINGESFYLYTVWYVLKMSSGRTVYPIHHFKPGTYHFDVYGDHTVDDYEQAKAVTAYFCRYGWADWGIGNSAATWKDGVTPDVVMGYFGLERGSYDIEALP